MPHVVVRMHANDERTRHLLGNPDLVDWLGALGVPARTCRAFRVFADGDGTVEITGYVRGPDGERVFNEARDDLVTETYTVPLTAPIPPPVLRYCRL